MSGSNSNKPVSDRISDSLQNIIHTVLGAHSKGPRILKTLLSGTILGHPLHPLITDIPIGSWVLTAIFDAIWLYLPDSQSWAAQAALVTAIIGLVGALGAALTGLADWSDTYGSERRTGLYHAEFNVLATVLYLASTILRFQTHSYESILAAILAYVGLISLTIAGYLGGEMVFGKGTGVNHTAWEWGSDKFVSVMAEKDIEENKLYRVDAAGVPVVLMKMNNQFYAIAATCTHAGGPLNEGQLQGDVVECPWHGSRFSMCTGRALCGPATIKQPRYEVRLTDGQVEVKLASSH